MKSNVRTRKHDTKQYLLTLARLIYILGTRAEKRGLPPSTDRRALHLATLDNSVLSLIIVTKLTPTLDLFSQMTFSIHWQHTEAWKFPIFRFISRENAEELSTTDFNRCNGIKFFFGYWYTTATTIVTKISISKLNTTTTSSYKK